MGMQLRLASGLEPAADGVAPAAISCLESGGAKGIRTLDLLNAIQTLFQLSYSPTRSAEYSKGPLADRPLGTAGSGSTRPRFRHIVTRCPLVSQLLSRRKY